MTEAPPRVARPGEVYWIDFDPTKGTEQSGVRPAVVVSNALFNARSQHVIVCPLTRNTAPWPTKVVLDAREEVEGAVLVDQIRTIHRSSRGFRYAGTLSPDAMRAVRAILVAIVAPTP